MGRTLDPADPPLAAQDPEHPRWADVAERCLACGNCTMVCPTCFCNSVEDSTSLDGNETERTRVWDSCFTVDLTHLHGCATRTSTSSRYRQWLLHKLVTWHDQFDMSGCVGCGRCITWCPVGIDLTAEVAALAQKQEVLS
jgi:sulfhydrogenase subunit beta (sulfur reductase)